MVDKAEIKLETGQYQDELDDDPNWHMWTTVRADRTENELMISTLENPTGRSEHFSITIELATWAQVDEIRSFLEHHRERDISIDRTKTLEVESLSGIANSSYGMWEGYSTLDITAKEDEIQFHAKAGMNPYIRFNRYRLDGEVQDEQNLDRFLEFLRELGPGEQVPTLHVEFSDTQLQEECLPKYLRGDYREAIQAAGQLLEGRVQQLTPAEYDKFQTRKLMQKVFSEGNPAIQLAEDDGEQNGIMFLYSGFMGALRNPTSHPRTDAGNDHLDDLDKQQTYKALQLADLLLSWLPADGNSL